MGPLTKRMITIQGDTGNTISCPWTSQRTVDLGKNTVTHLFLVIPDCLYPLIERDLLQKFKATISFEEKRAFFSTNCQNLEAKHHSKILVTCPLTEEYLLQEDKEQGQGKRDLFLAELQSRFPQVWVEGNPPGIS